MTDKFLSEDLDNVAQVAREWIEGTTAQAPQSVLIAAALLMIVQELRELDDTLLMLNKNLDKP